MKIAIKAVMNDAANNVMRQNWRALIFVIASVLSAPANAHKSSDSYLSLNIAESKIDGQWDISLRDLDFAIGLDANGDGEITWDEVRAKQTDIAAYALSRLSFVGNDTACPATVSAHLIDDHTDGSYAVLRFNAVCNNPVSSLSVHYRLLFDVDPQHRGLLKLQNRGLTSTAIFSPASATQSFVLVEVNRLKQFNDFLITGVWHIFSGFDHILFLLSLLLPAVLIRVGQKWQPAQSFKVAFIDVLKIVTAFTLAHSVTLTLVTLQLISLPSRFVESVIAASVIIAALNNIFPLLVKYRWVAAFAFGLIHGFGFASVLSDLALPQSALLLALVGFNFGVEIGQLAIVGVFLPLAYILRRSGFYLRSVLTAGSVLIALIALVWFIERAFDIKIIS